MALSGAYGTRGVNPTFASRFLDTVGDGTGSVDMAVDGSVTPVEFKVICPPDKLLIGNMFAVLIEDTGVTAENYGGIVGGLTNGVTGYILKADSTLIPWFAQLPVRQNSDWTAYCDSTRSGYGAGSDALRFVYDFQREGPGLALYPGDEGGLIINDDCTTLIKHHCRFGMTQYDYNVPVI